MAILTGKLKVKKRSKVSLEVEVVFEAAGLNKLILDGTDDVFYDILHETRVGVKVVGTPAAVEVELNV